MSSTDLRLADGTLIDKNGKRTISTDINNNFKEPSAKNELIAGRRRYLDDLPMPFLQSKPVAIVAAYSMFGLTPGDIARILDINVSTIVELQSSNDFTVFMDSVLQNVREHDTNKVRKKLNKNAEKASDKIVELMDSDNEKISLAASQDILNRTGHKPADIHEHRMEGGFTIRHIKSTEAPPSIDVEVNDEGI